MRAMALLIFLLSAAAPGEALAQISAPVAVRRPNCAVEYYPRSAIKDGVQGTVMVSLTITAQGDVTNASVRKSSGSGELDSAALTCLQHWHFTPAMKDNVPIESSNAYMISFGLDQLTGPLSAEIVRAAQKCAMQPLSGSEEFNGGTAITTIDVQFEDGAVARVNILDASGNKELDQRAQQCVENLPADLVQKVTRRRGLFIEFPWHAAPPQKPIMNAITVQHDQ
jgi:TonB family protein